MTVDAVELAVANATRTSILRTLDAQDSGLLPQGTRLVRRNGHASVHLVELEPRLRTVHWDHGLHLVPTPWVVFIVSGSALRVFFRSAPIASLDDELGRAPFPNFYDGRVCFGGPARAWKTPTDAIAEYWGSGFTTNSRGYDSDYDGSVGLADFKQMTLENVLSRRWKPHRLSLRQHLDDFVPTIDEAVVVRHIANSAAVAALLELQT